MSDLPVVPGEVVGWRAWVVVIRREPRLRSLYQPVIWPTDRWLIAEALDYDTVPHGICAARDLEHLNGMTRYMMRGQPRYVEGSDDVPAGIPAMGRVGLAGVIREGERGYRAEKARVLSILLPHAAWELVAPLRRDYGVPVGLANVLDHWEEHRGHRS